MKQNRTIEDKDEKGVEVAFLNNQNKSKEEIPKKQKKVKVMTLEEVKAEMIKDLKYHNQ